MPARGLVGIRLFVHRRQAVGQHGDQRPLHVVRIDSFPDLVASKMVALVERGAPRDFRDIHALCQANLITPVECWNLWRQRQQLAESDTESSRAQLAVETHLARIASHRPLEQIADAQQRTEANRVRNWFRKEFLDALQASS